MISNQPTLAYKARFSPYREENATVLHYKDQLQINPVYGNNSCLSANHTKPTNTPCKKNTELTDCWNRWYGLL